MAARQEVTFVIRARDAASAVFRRMRRSFKRMAVAAGLLGGALAGAVGNALTMARDLENMADRAGLGVEQFQALSRVLDGFGSDARMTADVLQRLQAQAGRAQEGGPLQEAFAKLGVTFNDLATMRPDQMLYRIADAVQQMGDTPEVRDLLRLVGETEFARLFPALQRGGDFLKEAAQEAREAGVQSAEGIRREAERSRQLRREIDAAQARINGELLKLVPLLTSAITDLSNLIERANLPERVAAAQRRGDAVTAAAAFVAPEQFTPEVDAKVLEIQRAIARNQQVQIQLQREQSDRAQSAILGP